MEDYRLKQIQQIDQQINEAKQLLSDPSMADLVSSEIESLQKQKKELEESMRGNGQEKEENLDTRNVILEVKGAAGGEEAKLWAQNLIRMYVRYAEGLGFNVESLDEYVLKISGQLNALGPFAAFKYEAGVHRVQRIPKTEKRGRIHTSTATVAILPELEDIDLHINPEDIEFEAFRSGGHGGQNVNKVSTAVRIRHLPSAIVVTSQSERSQGQNRELAMELLRAKLWEIEMEKQQGQLSSLKSTQVGRGMRAEKIRTYNFPQDRLTDHRINKSWRNLEGLLDGDLSEVTESVKATLEKSA